ncbi:MFS transporter [Chloroflexota bacterium]
MNIAGKTKLFYGYVIVLACFCTTLAIFGTLYTFGVFFKPVLTEFGWTRAAISGAFSLNMFLSGVLGIVAGRLTDKFGPRLVMTACGFFLGIGYLLMSQVTAIWQFYLFYGVIVGLGMSGSFAPLASTIARWFVDRRGMMMGTVLAGVGFGAVIMPPVAGWLVSIYGWRTSYIIVGIVALVIITSAAQFLRRDPGQMEQLAFGAREVKAESLDLQHGGFSLQEATRTVQFGIVCAVLFCFGFITFAVMVHVVPHATDLGFSATTAARIIAIIGGVSIVAKVIMGGAADRIGNKAAYIIGFALSAATLFWLLAAREVWMLYLFAIIYSFGYSALVVLEAPLVAELFGLSSLGVIIAVAGLGFTIGAAMGPLLAGYIFDITASYQLAFLICAVVGIMGAVLTSFIRPVKRKGLIGHS